MTLIEKGPLALASGPSLGRKRPRRAAITQKRYRTATTCDRAAQKASTFGLFPVQNPKRPTLPRKAVVAFILSLFSVAWVKYTPRANPVIEVSSSTSRIRDRKRH
jgi:hypothetical protein